MTNDPTPDPAEAALEAQLRSAAELVDGHRIDRSTVETDALRRRTVQRRRRAVATTAAAVVVVMTAAFAVGPLTSEEEVSVQSGGAPSTTVAPLGTTSTTWCGIEVDGSGIVLGAASLSEGQVGVLQEVGLADATFTERASRGPVDLTEAQVGALTDRGEELSGRQVLELLRVGPEIVLAWLEGALVPATPAQADAVRSGDGDGLSEVQAAALVTLAEELAFGIVVPQPDGILGRPERQCPDGAGEITTTSMAPDGSGASTTTVVERAPADGMLPSVGDPVAELRIPAIDVDATVVSGATADQLAVGPGHDPRTPLPGQAGNAVIAGHRTEAGAPFERLGELRSGDQIVVTTAQGTFAYRVTELQVVEPTAVELIDDQGDDRLTLVTLHPKFSSAQRLVVTAVLVDAPASPLAGQDAARATASEAGDEPAFAGP